MQEAIGKAKALVEAHQYIRRFADKIVVVKIGGSIMDEPETLRGVIMDVCFMDAMGMHPVLVHGGGKGITEAMKKVGLEAQFVQGRRYTDDRTLSIAEHVLINDISNPIVEMIRQAGHKATALNSLGSCVVFGKRLFLEVTGQEPGDKPRKVDLGLVGEVQGVNADLLRALVEAEYIPVIAPIARDSAGGKLNINADSVAGHVAAALKADKFVLVSDTHGIRTGAEADTLASSLTRSEIEKLVDDGIITAGMLPKVEACLVALEAGVTKCHIVDGRLPHALMLEVYTDRGIGTEISL